jgi:hypothetical protein
MVNILSEDSRSRTNISSDGTACSDTSCVDHILDEPECWYGTNEHAAFLLFCLATGSKSGTERVPKDETGWKGAWSRDGNDEMGRARV